MYKFYREITSSTTVRAGGETGRIFIFPRARVWGEDTMKIMINNNDMRFSPALNMYNKFAADDG